MLVICKRVVDCKAGPEPMWGAISNTDRLNWVAGMQAVTFKPLRDASPARYTGYTNLAGFDVSYAEEPYEWQYLRRFRVRRPMHSGPLRHLEMLFELEPLPDGGTRVRLQTCLEPRIFLLAPVAKVGGLLSLRDLERAVRRLDEELTTGASAAPTVKLDDALLASVRQRLVLTEPDTLVDRLLDLVRQGDDLQLTRLRPFALAEAWAVPRRAVLRLFLNACKLGLMTMRWEVICPSCRAGVRTVASPNDLATHEECQFCDIRFAVDMREAVEAVFGISSQVRESAIGPFCIGGPARTPHVLAQTILPSRGQGVLHVGDTKGMLRVFVRGGASSIIKVDAEGPERLVLRSDAMSNIDTPVVRAGGAVVVENAQDMSMHAKLERFEWTNYAATPRDVESMPEFEAHPVGAASRRTGG